MGNKLTTNEVAKTFCISSSTIRQLENKDRKFTKPIKIGREKYYEEGQLHEWLKSRATNPDALMPDDKIMSGARLLELTNRSKGWLWMNVIKVGKLTRINLSPDPESNKLINNFIEREVYEAYGDLIEAVKVGGSTR